MSGDCQNVFKGSCRLGKDPRLGGPPVGLVEPYRVALRGTLPPVVQRQPGGGRERVAASAQGRDAPQLRGGAVRLGQHRPAARLGQQEAARGDPVEARRPVALEVEGARVRGQRAARCGGRHGHPVVEGGREAVGAVVDRAGDRGVREQPRLGGPPVGLVEPYRVVSATVKTTNFAIAL